MFAREPRKDRRCKKAEKWHNQHEQQQSQSVVAAVDIRTHAQAGIKPDLRRQAAQQRKTDQTHCKHANDAFDDVLVLEMTQLMRQHRVYFARAKLLKQCVVKHHSLGRAKASEVSVCVSRSLAAVHHKQALGSKAAALHQCCHSGFQFFVVQRFELVEQRGNHGRVQHQYQQVKTHPRAPRPQPPKAAGAAHQPQNQRDNWQANHCAD